MSTVRSIERRIFQRRLADRELHTLAASQVALPRRPSEWGGIWSGYMIFAGVAILLLSFVLGVGFSSVNPMRPSSWAGAGSGMAIWSVIVLLIATFIGAWVAGRTPASTRRQGIAKGLVLWGMILLSALFISAWVAGQAINVAASGTVAAGNALTGASRTGVTVLQGRLRNDGFNVSRAQAADIGARIAAGHNGSAATALAHDSGQPPAAATTEVGKLRSSVAGIGGNVSSLAAKAAPAAKSSGSTLAWAYFWLALITLCCAVAGGALGGGGLRRTSASPRAPAAPLA